MPVLPWNSWAWEKLSWAPMPTTRMSSPCSRANCSTSGPSARQVGQCGAQNHRSTGWSPPPSSAARFTVSPVVTSRTSRSGKRFSAGADSSLSDPPPSVDAPLSDDAPLPDDASASPEPELSESELLDSELSLEPPEVAAVESEPPPQAAAANERPITSASARRRADDETLGIEG